MTTDGKPPASDNAPKPRPAPTDRKPVTERIVRKPAERIVKK